MRIRVENVHSTVYPTSEGEVKQLTDAAAKLSVMAPGAEYTWKFKKKQWNGKVYPIQKTNLEDPCFIVPTGYLPSYLEAVRAGNVQFQDHRSGLRNLQLVSSKVPLRDYQVEAARLAFTNTYAGMWWPRGVLRLATGLGKTEVAVAMMAMAGVPSVFLVDSKDLLAQAYDRCRKYGLDVGRLGDSIYEPGFVTVATVQTIGSMLASGQSDRLAFLRDVEFAFVDEAHGIAADLDKGNLFAKVLAFFQKAYIRLGLTATPFMRDEYSNMLLEGSTGRIIIDLDARWGIDHGYLSDAKVTMHTMPALNANLFRRSKEESGTAYSKAYVEAIEFNNRRNDAILDALLRVPGPTLVLVKTIAHGNALVQRAHARGMELPFVNGSHPVSQRRAAVARLVKTKGWLVATSIFKKGVDIPAIRGLVLAAGGKSEGMLLQQIGRGLRRAAGKEGLTVIDFYDLSRPLLKHSENRKRLWESEGYSVEVLGS